MSQSDTIADMLTCIRNAVRARHRRVDVPASNVRMAIAEALQRENYVANFKKIEDTKQGILRIYLRYDMEDAPVITNLVKISKPGRRIYVGKDRVPRVLGGLGSAILSTTKGILTDKEARAAGLGGEVLAKIW
jgi:small subunit ribosomal protein S8